MKFKIFLSTISIALLWFGVVVFAQPLSAPQVTATLHNPGSFLISSGVAYDASENILGQITVKDPRGFFKPDTDQVTWWGQFKPFKFWTRPELTAIWYEPPQPGTEVAQQEFKGLHCALAKTTLKTAELSQPLKEGTWRVDIYMQNKKIDSQQFIIYGGPQSKISSQGSGEWGGASQ